MSKKNISKLSQPHLHRPCRFVWSVCVKPRSTILTNFKSCTFRLMFSGTTTLGKHDMIPLYLIRIAIRCAAKADVFVRCRPDPDRRADQKRRTGQKRRTSRSCCKTSNFTTRRETCVAPRNRSGERNLCERNLIVDLQCLQCKDQRRITNKRTKIGEKGRRSGKEGEKRLF